MKAFRIVPAVLILSLLSGTAHLMEIGRAQAQNEPADGNAAASPPKPAASDKVAEAKAVAPTGTPAEATALPAPDKASEAKAPAPGDKPSDAKAAAPTEQHPGLVATIKDASGPTPGKEAQASQGTPVSGGSLPKSLDTCTFAEGADLLKQKEEALKERESKLAEREAMLVVTEVRVAHEIKRLAALREQLQKYADRAEAAPKEDAQRMAALYGAMKAAKAAERMDMMSPEMVVEVLDLIDETRATGILAAMDPAKAKEVTRLILDRNKPTPTR